MINTLDINGKKYDFLFDMEMVWHMNSSGKFKVIEGDDVRLECDYNDLLGLFLIANKAAVEYQDKGDELDLKTLKNGIRDPKNGAKLFLDLQGFMSQSEVLTQLSQLNGENKKKSHGTKSSN